MAAMKNAKKSDQPLILKSIRGHKNWAPMRCRECGENTCLTTTYKRSNKGKVTICDGCKPIVRARSKGHQKRGKFDAMNMIVVRGVKN